MTNAPINQEPIQHAITEIAIAILLGIVVLAIVCVPFIAAFLVLFVG